MLIIFKKDHAETQLQKIVAEVQRRGCQALVVRGLFRVTINVIGNDARWSADDFKKFEGVENVVAVTRPYILPGRDFQSEDSEITVNGVTFGGTRLVVIAGPCAVESEEQTLRIALAVQRAGADVLRGGAYKPRTSVFSFQGLAEEGLRILKKASEKTGLPVVTEAMDPAGLEAVNEYADIIQIGSRNMQNFDLLRQAGKLRKPVLLKRGMSASIDEWLQAAEYIMNGGNEKVILCERGIRSFDSQHTRNVLDLAAVPVLQRLSHLPVIVDPSHATGRRELVESMALASLGAGAQGIMLDVHDEPEKALCDGAQALHPRALLDLMWKLKRIASGLGKEMSGPSAIRTQPV